MRVRDPIVMRRLLSGLGRAAEEKELYRIMGRAA